MPKKRTGRVMKKIQPAPMSFHFEMPLSGGGAVDAYTIDLSQCASILNRRFYRQGLNWAVAGFKFIGTDDAVVSIQKLPSTWVMSNSWEKGFRAWQKMNNEALAESESVKPKFLDFKIYADATHHAAGFGANLLPGNYIPLFTPATAGEWFPSKYQIPDNTLGATGGVREREVIATGANFPGAGASGLDAVSLIEGYAASRGLPNILDPNVPQDAADMSGSGENWIGQLFTEGNLQDDRVMDDMISENNIAPYPFENDGVNVDTMYPGGVNQLTGLETHDLEFITPTTVGGTTRMQGGTFPCGLIRTQISKTSAGTGLINLQIDLVPGNHRGYLCEPMTEM
jgi:hypothetical protein